MMMSWTTMTTMMMMTTMTAILFGHVRAAIARRTVAAIAAVIMGQVRSNKKAVKLRQKSMEGEQFAALYGVAGTWMRV
jgi:hypothetical protein